MSTPVAAGIAALARTKWSDKDVYSSRFIMGQISANANPVVDGLASITVPPQPELTYLEHWLFDTTVQDPANDDDGIVDSGETVELAIVIRNHWGKADNVQVLLEPWAVGAFQPDPYVTMITDTVDYGAVGSFNWDDNGLIYDEEGVITGVHHPFRFHVLPETPNDHVIPFRVTMTAINGYDPDDPNVPYVFESRFYLIVQRGNELPRIVSDDMVLSKNFYWIVTGQTMIESGVTVTATEGAQVQWGTHQFSNPYAEPQSPYIQVEGSLIISGTQSEPVELFPSQLFSDPAHPVLRKANARIFNQGIVRLSNCLVDQPELGSSMAQGTLGVNSIDSCYLFGDGSSSLSLGNGGQGLVIVASEYISATRIHVDSLGKDCCIGGTFYSNLHSPVLNSVLVDASTGTYINSNSDITYVGAGTVRDSVFLQKNTDSWRIEWLLPETIPLYTDEQSAIDGTVNVDNAFLSKYWSPSTSSWMKFRALFSRNYYAGLANNFWGTTSSVLIDAAIHDYYDDVNLGTVVYQPIQVTPASTTYPFVVDVKLSTAYQPATSGLNGPTPVISAESVTFTVSFNRDMDQTVQPQVSFGPDVPMTDYTIHPVDGGWQDARTWVGTFNITPITGDGYQLIRVARAVAADDPWLVTGDDEGRFRFEIITSGTEAMNLQATGGEGLVNLSWTQDDFDLLAGYNLYRSTSADGDFARINTGLIPSHIKSYQDTDVTPGLPYFYKFTVVQTDMSESDFSNMAQGTPFDTIAPTLTHTPVTSAAPGLALSLHADATDNVAVQSVTLYYRTQGDPSYVSQAMVLTTGNTYNGTIPAFYLTSPGIDYYIVASDGIGITRSGRPEAPHQVAVEDEPVVITVSPMSGPESGDTTVTVAGSNFKAGASVTFGGAIASDVSVLSSSQITCVTPSHFPSMVDVTVTNPDAQSGTLLSGFTYVSDVASMSIPATGGGQNSTVQIPINLADVSGLAAASLTVQFDPAILQATHATVGNLTPGWALAVNTSVGNQMRLSMASSGSLVSGSGVLAYLEFDVVGAPGSSSVLDITSVSLNDGSISVDVADGSFDVDQVYSVSGDVTFWNGGAGVPSVQTELNGDIVYYGLGDATGTFTVTGAASGDYVLTAEKSDDATGISAYDASLVLRHDVGTETLSGHAFTAGDVNRNGSVSSMDAFYILQKAVDLITVPFPGAGIVWDFSPAQRSVNGLSSNVTGQNFTAILLGDPSGNWAPPVQGASTADSPVTIELNTKARKQAIDIDLVPNGESTYSLELTLSFDESRYKLLEPELGASLDGWMISTNLAKPGQVLIAIASATPITKLTRVLSVPYEVLAGDGTPFIQVTRAVADEKDITPEPPVFHDSFLPMVTG